MIDLLFVPAKPAIIIPKPPELVRPGDPRFNVNKAMLGGLGVMAMCGGGADGGATSILTQYRGLYLDISHGGGANTGLAEIIFHERAVGDINASGNTKIGNMTGGGGLAAAFDGTTVQAYASCATRAANSGSTCGIDWGSGQFKDVDTIFLKEPSDSKIDGGNTTRTVTVVLKGTTDGSASGGTTIQTWTTIFSGLPNRPTAGWDAGATLNVDNGTWA